MCRTFASVWCSQQTQNYFRIDYEAGLKIFTGSQRGKEWESRRKHLNCSIWSQKTIFHRKIFHSPRFRHQLCERRLGSLRALILMYNITFIIIIYKQIKRFIYSSFCIDTQMIWNYDTNVCTSLHSWHTHTNVWDLHANWLCLLIASRKS